MADKPINLNKFRKARARAAAKARAEENSIRSGRPKAERDAQNLEIRKRLQRLDDHKRDDDE